MQYLLQIAKRQESYKLAQKYKQRKDEMKEKPERNNQKNYTNMGKKKNLNVLYLQKQVAYFKAPCTSGYE